VWDSRAIGWLRAICCNVLPAAIVILLILHPSRSNLSLLTAGTGVIKAVLSGDTVVLQGVARPGTPAPEMQVSLSGLMAPKMSRHPEARDEVGPYHTILAFKLMLCPRNGSWSTRLGCSPLACLIIIVGAAFWMARSRVFATISHWQAGASSIPVILRSSKLDYVNFRRFDFASTTKWNVSTELLRPCGS
jgi:hypothetical protein